jgi:hypothetical protein
VAAQWQAIGFVDKLPFFNIHNNVTGEVSMVQTSHEESKRMIDSNCDCQLMIEEVSAESNSNGMSVKCKMSVLASSDPSQVGKTTSEFFKCDGKAAGMFLNVAEAAGLITRQQRIAAQEQGVGMDIDETLLKGRQIGATIRMEPNMRKNPVTGQNEVDPEKPGPYPRIGFNTYSIWDQKASKIPLDMQFAVLMPKPAGYGQGQGQGPAAGTAGATAPQAQTAPTQPPTQDQQGLPLSGPQNPTVMNW